MKRKPVFENRIELILKIGLICFSIVSITFYVLIGNNNVLWCDEIASVVIAKKPFWELIELTANDVHPPLYYLILRVSGLIFGFSGPIMHFVSIIPYAMIIICSLTMIWKRHGIIAASLMIFMSSLLYCSMHFNVEVRMYSWASFFILMSYLYFNEVLISSNYRNSLLFVLWSLLAAYTHYFCIITVAPFYLTILTIGLIKKKAYLKNSLIIWGVTILLYLPWAISFLMHYTTTTSKIYSARYNSILQCLEYIFKSKFSWILLCLFLIIVCISFFTMKDQFDYLWVIIGIVSISLTILVPYLISVIMSPIMEERHVYPSFIIAWMALGVCISKFKSWWRYAFLLLVTISIVPFGMHGLVYSYEEAMEEERELNYFLTKTEKLIPSSEPVITDEWQIGYSLLQYYYSSDINTLLISGDMDIDYYINDLSEKDSDYWIFIKEELDAKAFNKMCDLGYECELVVENGLIGSHRTWVYKCWKCEV